MKDFVYAGTDDLGAWSALRTQLYLASGLLAQDDLAADGLYHDQYEAHSDHYFIESGDGLRIGTYRLIDGRRGPLQVADQFGISPEPDGFEISGFAIGAGHRASGAPVGVYRECYRVAVERGFTTAYMEVEDWLLESLLRLGLPARVLDSPRWTFNAQNYALAIRIADVVDALRAADTRRGGQTRYGEEFAEHVRRGQTSHADPFGAGLDEDGVPA